MASLPIINSHVCVDGFEPVWKDIDGFPGFRISSNYAIQSSLHPEPGKKSQWIPGGPWKRIATCVSRGNGVVMATLRANGATTSFPVKKLLWITFVGNLGYDQSLKCLDGDELNVSLANLTPIAGRFVRRTTLYRDLQEKKRRNNQ